MKIQFIYLTIIVLCFRVYTQEKCLKDSPIVFAKNFYLKYESFHYTNPVKFRKFITPRLFIALQKEYRCTEPGELCAIESNPWTDAQDGEIGEPIKFEAISSSDTSSSVKMSYTFILSENQKWAQSITLLLLRNSVKDCWKLADLKSTKEESFLEFIEGWHKEFNNEK